MPQLGCNFVKNMPCHCFELVRSKKCSKLIQFLFQIDLIHLGAKYAPCMRWDSVLDREIKEERLKERDTACCIRKDRSGCVQSPKSECSKINDPNGVDGQTPRSKWVMTLIYYTVLPTVTKKVIFWQHWAMWTSSYTNMY